MKRIFRIIVLIHTLILFVTSLIWILGICVDSPMSFTYILGYALVTTIGVILFILGLFGLCKLGDWAFKKD